MPRAQSIPFEEVGNEAQDLQNSHGTLLEYSYGGLNRNVPRSLMGWNGWLQEIALLGGVDLLKQMCLC